MDDAKGDWVKGIGAAVVLVLALGFIGYYLTSSRRPRADTTPPPDIQLKPGEFDPRVMRGGPDGKPPTKEDFDRFIEQQKAANYKPPGMKK